MMVSTSFRPSPPLSICTLLLSSPARPPHFCSQDTFLSSLLATFRSVATGRSRPSHAPRCHRPLCLSMPLRSARYSLRSQHTSLTTRGQNLPNQRRPPLPRIQHASHPPIHLWGIYDMAPIQLDSSFRFYF